VLRDLTPAPPQAGPDRGSASQPSETPVQHARPVLDLVGLGGLVEETSGREVITVAVIDGPADLSHPDLAGAGIAAIPSADIPAACAVPASSACRHGTFVVGMLAARRAGAAPGLCPGCKVIVRPIFCEARPGSFCPVATPADLAAAVANAVDAGAKIVNLSVGVDSPVLARHPAVDDSLDYAAHRGVIVVTAAGNHGLVGPAPMISHPWPVPVAACDASGRPLRLTNIGIGIGRTGLLAPGLDVPGLAPGGGFQRLTGTSAAAPFVSATAALLWSLRPALTAPQVRAALLRPGVPRRSVIPPLLDAAASRRALGTIVDRFAGHS
jgi:subtilisin family serine protease